MQWREELQHSLLRIRSLLQHALVALAGVLLCTALADAQSDTGVEQRRIREIRIIRANVYSEDEAKESSWDAVLNRTHILTREKVIRTELLFKQGEVLDQQLLESSERKLRRFRFLNKVELLVVPVDEKTVDVEVLTKDAWSLEPGMNVSGGGGLASVSGHLIEFNLLGLGKKLFAEATYENDVGTTWNFGYSDYQILKSRWIGSARYRTGPLVESFFAQARLPLYSPDSAWSFGGSAYNGDRIIRLFENGVETSRFAKEGTQFNGVVTRSLGPRYKKTHLNFRLQYQKADYSALGTETTSPLPPDVENITPTVGIDKENISFVKNTYINKMGIVEDKWMGLKYGGRVGYGIPIEDSLELWDTRAFVNKNFAFKHDQLLYLNSMVTSEIVRNTFVMAGAKYYKKFTRHTLATNFKANFGYELDTSRQFQLGADSGLRGYPAREFTGDRLMLMNLEDRQFWGEFSLGPKVALGSVVFVDAGNVWARDENIELSDLNWSTGFGLRIGMSNLPRQPILRVDLGWALGGDSFAVTVGSEQQF